jgi:putative heme transporter
MTATAGSPSVTIRSPGQLGSPDRGTTQPAIARPRPGRKIFRAAVSAALVAAIFGFALPRFASYRSVWASMSAMTWPQALLLGAAAAASMASTWLMICSVLPSIRLREAAVVNLGSSAVANTLPAGGALAMGVSWAMLSSWGISTADYVLYTLVSGIWNVLARLGLPVPALLVLMTVSRPGADLIAAAAAGLALLAIAVAGLGLLLRSESFALRAGRTMQRTAAVAFRLARRQLPPNLAGWPCSFRGRAAALIAARGWPITAATAASNLTLWLVLLACLRGTGLSQAQVPWQTSLAAFAFVRLLTVLPVTPGGLGITELGLVSILAAGAGHRASAQVTAAVLLYRAVTYLAPIPLGALACLSWRHAPALTRSSPHNARRQAIASITTPASRWRIPQSAGVNATRPAASPQRQSASGHESVKSGPGALRTRVWRNGNAA